MTRSKLITNALVAVLLGTLLVSCQSTTSGKKDLPVTDDRLSGKFIWHDLMTDDVEQAKTFYSGLLGWSFESSTRPDVDNYTLIRSSAGYYVGGMVEVQDPGKGTDYSRWFGYMSVDDVDKAVEKTTNEGGKVIASARSLGPVARVAAVSDPQGAIFGLIDSKVGDPADSFEASTGHVLWNELLTVDTSMAGEFYSSLAGLKISVIERRGGEYLLLQGDGYDRAGVQQRPQDDVEPLWLTHFKVDDPARAAQQAEALGGTIILAPTAEVRDGSMALVTDTSGALLALSSK